MHDMSGKDISSAPWGVSSEAVRSAVERVVASSDFNAPDRVKRFLRYIVEETLAGRADRIKAFSVAIDVFDRDKSFDAHTDPLVRIEAGRLRRALEHYYLTSGADDPVRIDVPKGAYVPSFSPQASDSHDTPASPEAGPATQPRSRNWRRSLVGGLAGLVVVAGIAWLIAGSSKLESGSTPEPRNPSVLVLPFASTADQDVTSLFSAALTDQLISELARFKEIRVFGAQTARSLGPNLDVEQIHNRIGADYLVEGRVAESDGTIRVSTRLIDGGNGKVIWNDEDKYELSSISLDAAQVDLAGNVAAAIAQPYGIVFRREVTRQTSRLPDDLDAYLCTLSYYTYRSDPGRERHENVLRCLQNTVAEHPRYATALALLALVYVDQIRAGFNPDSDAPSMAIETAREAARLEPENARALQALSGALFFGGHLSESLKVGRQAVALNPNDTELLGQVGQQIGLSGQVEEGRKLIKAALERNPGHSDFYRGALAMMDYLAEDYGAALATIDQVNLRGLPIYHGVAAIILARNDQLDRAADMARKLQEMAPTFIPNLWSELDMRNIPGEAQLRIAEDLDKAGVIVPPRVP